MSYEYARIPLKPGLNMVCGPNGAGKSSILLAISVALGQAYTERSRKLSDLIRWGKDSARATIVFDNTPKNGKRPVPKFDVDYFRLSRYIKKDGNYWFEANFQIVNKNEVTNILGDFGINPDNILIIMHQHMMEEFGVITPRQKLEMVEEAVGLGEYRRNLIEAQEKLSQVLSEEESVKSLLENAEQTLAYWKEEYDKYQRGKELLRKKEFLERELVWSQFAREEDIVEGWKNKIKKRQEDLAKLQKEAEKTKEAIQATTEDLNLLHHEQRNAFYTLLALEKEKTEHEVTESIYSNVQTKISGIKTEQLKGLDRYLVEVESQISSSQRRLKSLDEKISTTQSDLTKLDEKIDSTSKTLLDERVHEGLLNFQIENTDDEINALNRELRTAERELDQFTPQLEKAGARIKTERTPQEISEEIKITNIQIVTLGDISEDVEKMYITYSSLYNDLKAKAMLVSENREKTLMEVEERRKTWRKLVESLLDEVSQTFQSLLSKIDATGRVRLIDAQDIETAGLELIIGFKGAEPTILDTHTQSGGERSGATMAFLLALQQHVKSPFRAVDEFDVHMDPRNREVFSDMLFKEISKNVECQYLTITPGQLTNVDKTVHVITVQNVEGRSDVKVVA